MKYFFFIIILATLFFFFVPVRTKVTEIQCITTPCDPIVERLTLYDIVKK